MNGGLKRDSMEPRGVEEYASAGTIPVDSYL